MGAGGAARTMLNIINNLDRNIFTPILVTLNYDGNYEEHVKSDVRFIKLETKRLRSAILPLAKVIRNERIDMVFSTIPNYNTISILGNMLSFTHAKNIVREADNLGGNFKTNVKLIGYGMLYKLTSQVISLSEGVKDNLVKRYKLKPESIKVIYNPVDLENIRNNMENGIMVEEHTKLFTGDEPVIITAGRLVKQKDHHTLINAFAKVNEKIKSKLIILGEGELENELKQQAKKLNLEEKIHFLGFQKNPYIYFKHADLFVLSSIHEGFGHVIAEALATGTPVVSTNCKSGPEEVLQSGKYGMLCEVGHSEQMANQIYQILTLTKEEKNHLVEKGIKRAEDFDAKKIVKQYEQTFLETLAR